VTPELINRLANHAVVRQLVRFAIAGAIATAAHYTVLISLVEIGHVPPVIATTLGYCVGIVVSYVLNRRYTFETKAPVASSFLKFGALYGVGMFLNGAIVATLIAWGAPYMLAQVVATGLVLIWNYLAARFVAFR